MSSLSAQTALQNFFDDLLGDTSASLAPLAEAEARTQAKPEAQPEPLPYAPQSLEILERSKREQLQALLNSHAFLAPAAEPEAVSDAGTVTAVETVVELETSTELEIGTELEATTEVETATDAEPVIETTCDAPATVTDAEPEFRRLQMAPSTPAITAPAVDVAPPVELDEPPAVGETELAESAVTASNIAPYLAWHNNGRPQWAQNRFDALLFEVAGLTLAVPLIALGQIHPLSDELTPLFGQADWFMGLLPTSSGKIRTVNTALFVMPERYRPEFLDGAKYVVSIDGVPWGLAVDEVQQPVSLDPDDVKWRTERSKRPWLAGTVKSAMCALLDIPQMGHMLMSADKNYRASS